MTAWTWVWNSQAPPPNANQFRTDSRDWVSALQLNIDKTSNDGVDHTADLMALKVGDWIQVQHNLDPTRNATFELTAVPVVTGGCIQVAAVYNNGAGVLPNSGTQCLVTLRYMPVSMQTPGQKAYSGYTTVVVMNKGAVQPWANLSPVDRANWESAGKAAQT